MATFDPPPYRHPVNTTTVAATSWNGPICPTCGARYLNAHTCSRDDIARRIQQLLALLVALPAPTSVEVHPGFDMPDPTRNCPCRPENGGSGVCGCVLGGPRITCSDVPS